MAKGTTIASLNRQAAKDEAEFHAIITMLLDEADHERTAEFFDRLNIPRSVGSEANHEPIKFFEVAADKVGTWEQERAISDGLQKFMDRHERKLKWHAGHPSVEGCDNTMLLTRCAMALTDLRLKRLLVLLEREQELAPLHWSIARELMNRTFLSFRNFLSILAGDWIDAMQAAVAREELAEKLGNFYEFIDTHVRMLEGVRDRIEERRALMTVIPDGFPPVKPPNYFGGDLLGRGPWKQFWAGIDNKAHHFREAIG